MPQGLILNPLHRRLGPDQAILPTPPVSDPPNQLCTGLMSRDLNAAQTSMRNVIDSAVVQYNWRDLQQSAGTLNMPQIANLIADLDWCHANMGTSGLPIKARLRLTCGTSAPNFILNNVGNMLWYAKQGGQAVGPPAPSNPTWKQMGNIVIWWRPALWDYWRDFMTLLMGQVAGHPALAEVTMSAPMSEYAEICLHQFGNVENRATAESNGYTLDADIQSFRNGFATMAATVLPTGIATHVAFNPLDTIKLKTDPTTGLLHEVLKPDASQSINLMELMATTLSRRGVYANLSLIAPLATRGDPYTALYSRQINGRAQTLPFPWPIAYQTATLTKIQAQYGLNAVSTVPLSIETAISWGATSVELPVGCQVPTAGRDYISPSAAAAYNAQFITNTAPLLV